MHGKKSRHTQVTCVFTDHSYWFLKLHKLLQKSYKRVNCPVDTCNIYLRMKTVQVRKGARTRSGGEVKTCTRAPHCTLPRFSSFLHRFQTGGLLSNKKHSTYTKFVYIDCNNLLWRKEFSWQLFMIFIETYLSTWPAFNM